MKHQLLAIAAAILSLVACTSDEDALSAYRNDPTAVRITAQVGTTTTDGFTTRSNPIDADKQTVFNQNDQISVSADGQGAVTYEYNGTEWTPQDGKYLKWENDKMQFKAFYPATFTGTITQPTSFASEADLAAADFMTFSGEQSNTNGNKLALTMERQMARVIIVIDAFNNQYSNAEVESIKLCGDVVAYKKDQTFYALIKPGYTASADANFLTLTVKDGEATTTETLATIPTTMEKGKSYTYHLIVGKNKLQIANVMVEDWGTGGVIADEKAMCIGVTTEAQLRAAFQQGGNYKLGADITMTDDLPSLNDSQKTITLDLNNHTMENFYLKVNNGTLNVKNGTLVHSNSNPIGVGGGLVNVENCTLKGKIYAFYHIRGTSTLKGCIFYGLVTANGGGGMTLKENNVFNSGSADEKYKGIEAVDNGRFTCEFDPTGNLHGGKVINNGDGTWTVFDRICTEDLLQAALNAGGSYTLGANITLSKKLNVVYEGKTTTLDLNNYNMSYDGSDDLMRVYIQGDNNKLTLKNGKLISTSFGNVLTINCGNVEIENCVLTGYYGVLYHQTSNAFTFTMSNSTVNGILNFSTLATVNLKAPMTFGKGSAGSAGGIQVSIGSVTCDFDPAGSVLSGSITANTDNTWTVTAAN